MDGIRVIVVALLLCLAPLGGISAGALQDGETGMSVVPEENTSEYLAPPPDSIDQTGQRGMAIDVAGSVSANAGEVRSTYYLASLKRIYDTAATDEERQEVVRNGTERIVERVDELERQERRAIQRYNEGEISETQLLRRLAIVNREARAIAGEDRAIDWLNTRADNLGMDSTSDRLSLQQTRLLPLLGPVRSDLASALDGEDDVRVHVETSGDGIVLAMVHQSGTKVEYVREAYDPTAKTVNIGDRYNSSISAAEGRLEELYPWVVTDNVATVSTEGPAFARIYQFTYPHRHGQLTVYLDSGSGEVLQDIQRKDPEAVPTSTLDVVDDDLRLVLNRTRAGGSLGVAVYDASSGEPVDARIEFDGDAVGRTGGDRVWTVAPRGEVRINATDGDRTLSHETSFE